MQYKDITREVFVNQIMTQECRDYLASKGVSIDDMEFYYIVEKPHLGSKEYRCSISPGQDVDGDYLYFVQFDEDDEIIDEQFFAVVEWAYLWDDELLKATERAYRESIE